MEMSEGEGEEEKERMEEEEDGKEMTIREQMRVGILNSRGGIWEEVGEMKMSGIEEKDNPLIAPIEVQEISKIGKTEDIGEEMISRAKERGALESRESRARVRAETEVTFGGTRREVTEAAREETREAEVESLEVLGVAAAEGREVKGVERVESKDVKGAVRLESRVVDILDSSVVK